SFTAQNVARSSSWKRASKSMRTMESSTRKPSAPSAAAGAWNAASAQYSCKRRKSPDRVLPAGAGRTGPSLPEVEHDAALDLPCVHPREDIVDVLEAFRLNARLYHPFACERQGLLKVEPGPNDGTA